MSKKTSPKSQKLEKLKADIEQGIHPMQHSDVKKRKKHAEGVADKIIEKALSTSEQDS